MSKYLWVILVLWTSLPVMAQTYSVSVTATNGTVTLSPAGGSYASGTVVRLIPLPSVGYCFSSWTGDLTSKRLAPTVTVTSNLSITANFVVWRAPVGIPTPSFGITQTYRMYDDADLRATAIAYNSSLTGFGYSPSDSGGYYTHYIDNSAEAIKRGATDTSNPYGTYAKPRVTIPINSTIIPAGSIVEIHGGPYKRQYGWDLKCTGTEALPIFIRGYSATRADFPKLDGSDWPTASGGYGVRISGSYTIFENLHMYHCYTSVQNRFSSTGIARNEYIAFRNLYCQGNRVLNRDDNVIFSGASACPADNIVFYACESHAHGVSEDSTDDDQVNVALGNYLTHLWLVDNHLYDCQSDSVQITSSTVYGNNYYIGRNVMHGDGENAIDVKGTQDVIISQNATYDYHPSDPPYGDATMVFHIQSVEPGPLRDWVIYNEIEDARTGISCSSGTQSVYVIGNEIYNIDNWAIQGWNGLNFYAIGNTIYDCGNGISLVTSTAAYIANNIVSGLTATTPTFVDVEYAPMSDVSECQNNLFYASDGTVRITWGTTTYTSLAAFQTATSKGEDCVTGDPTFTSTTIPDFHLQAGSPAIDAGLSTDFVQTVFDLFQTTYNLDIRTDLEGNLHNGTWDLGALEYDPALPPGAPTSPTPADDATEQSNSLTLAWTAGAYVAYYQVRLDTVNPPINVLPSNCTATSIASGALAAGTEYFWQVISVNGSGTAASAVWSFTTETPMVLPGSISVPSPADTATDVSLTPTLSWTAATGAETYDVYCDTNASPTTVISNDQTGVTCAAGTLTASTTYYWKVVPTNAAGDGEATVYSFTTRAAGVGTKRFIILK